MKYSSSPITSIGILCLTATTAWASNPGATCDVSTAPDASTPRIYVIGDSTASNYDASLWPRMGWAQTLQDFFRPGCAVVENRALSGRSSKSFRDEGAWAPIEAALKPGDFVLIQFGHNDEKSNDPTRYTEPFSTYQAQLSQYVAETFAKGAQPILLTSIVRNRWSGTDMPATHGDYPRAVRLLGSFLEVPVIDMTTISRDYFELVGETTVSNEMFLNLQPGVFPNYPQGRSDNTHFQELGARRLAQLVLFHLTQQRSPLVELLPWRIGYPAF